MLSNKKTLFINLMVLISIIITIQITYGLPILKLFNSIHIKNVINIETINDNANNDKHNDENNNKNNENINNINLIVNKNINNYNYNSAILLNNYTINATVTKHSIIFNPATTYFVGEVVLSYNNNFDNHFCCKININPHKHKSSKDIMNYIYYEFNLSKLINLTCNNEKCIFKTYYEYTYNFDYFICDIKYNTYINDEF